jgi:hypothetical protein
VSDDGVKKRARDWEARLVTGAQEVAQTGDRWFVSVVEDAVGAGRWARREADVIGGSMTAALETTIDVAKKLRPQRSSPNGAPASSDVVAGSPDRIARPSNIELLEALADVGVPPQTADSELALHRAGIAPLLAALREVVSSRAADGYESLESDERFWALLELIHAHKRGGPVSADGEPDAENEGSR